MFNKIKKFLGIKESYQDSIFGQPVNLESIYSYRGMPLQPIWARDIYQNKATTLRILLDFDRVRNLARYLWETNAHAHGLLSGLRSYVLGGGYTVLATPKDRAAKGDIENLNEFLLEYIEKLDLDTYYSEQFIRAHRDGECFLRLFPQADGITQLRFIEPDNIRPPLGEDHEGTFSFGIKAPLDDSSNVQAFNINYPRDNTDEPVEVIYIKHLKLNVLSNVKRGISSFYPVDTELKGVNKLRFAFTEGAKVRASIPYVRQHALADKSAIEDMQTTLSTETLTRSNSDGSTRDVKTQITEPGMVHDIPKGMEYVAPPATLDAEAFSLACSRGLEAVAARFNAPSWLVTGSADASSYASSLSAESPFVKRIEFEQRIHSKYWKHVLEAIVTIAQEQGILPENTLDKFNIRVEAPSSITRNIRDENETYDLLHKNGIMAASTWAARNNLDLVEEQDKLKEEKDLIVPVSQNAVDEVAVNKETAPETMSGEMNKEVDKPK